MMGVIIVVLRLLLLLLMLLLMLLLIPSIILNSVLEVNSAMNSPLVELNTRNNEGFLEELRWELRLGERRRTRLR